MQDAKGSLITESLRHGEMTEELRIGFSAKLDLAGSVRNANGTEKNKKNKRKK